MLLRGARIVGSGSDEPTDVLLKRGVVVGIGAGLVGTATTELDGRWLMPGLWDSHVHSTQAALAARRVDLAGASSAAHAVALMAAAPRPPEGLPLVGFGFRDGLWPDLPTSAVVDAVIADIPVVMLSGDLHCVWLNTAATVRYSVAGHPTGVLREDDAFPVTAAIQEVPAAILDGWTADVLVAAAARGVVGITDFEMSDNIAAWSRRFHAGFRGARVEAGVYTAGLAQAIDEGWRTGDPVEGTDGLLTIGPYKIITDGSLNTRTAYCAHDYPQVAGAAGGAGGSRGALTVPTEELVARLRLAAQSGFVPAVHAIGDDANRLALDAFAAAGCGGRIEHAQLLLEADVSRFAALGVTASMQPEHAMDDRDVADRYWSGRTGRAFVLRSLLDSGATLLLGSDAPVAPLDPWVAMSAAVGRSRDGRGPWHREQAITAAEALSASTRGRSTVAVGDVADLVVVERDPLTSSHEQLRVMPVAATLLAGYFTHDAL